MLVTALAPLGAPLIGGYLFQWSSWRIIFGLLAVFGLICFTAVVWYLPESHPLTRCSRGPSLNSSAPTASFSAIVRR